MIDYKRALELLSYDPKAGIITWRMESLGGFKKSRIVHSSGDIAGCIRHDGRCVIRVDDRLYMRSRLAWLLQYGEWPCGEVDHINGIVSDDRVENLRVMNRRGNQENIRRAMASKTSSKYLGVYKNKPNRSMPWRASICTNGKQIYLGVFMTEEEAYAAYITAKRVLHAGCTI